MTEKAFWLDPYQTRLISSVTRIDHNEIELARTIFYAESGGQESDSGTIGGIHVIHARKEGLRILYTLEHSPGFRVGSEVETQIDWQRRYALMKLHFAAELVLELFTRAHGLAKIGAHISADKSRIDFICNENISGLLPDINRQAQQIITADLPIRSDFSDKQTQRRYWQIDGFAQVACGGTHLKRTAEIGTIHLKRKNIGKGKERVEITLGV